MTTDTNRLMVDIILTIMWTTERERGIQHFLFLKHMEIANAQHRDKIISLKVIEWVSVSLTGHLGGIGGRDLNLPSCGQLAPPSPRWRRRVRCTELLRQYDVTHGCGADAEVVTVVVVRLNPSLVYPAQIDSVICHWSSTVVTCVQDAVKSHVSVCFCLDYSQRDYQIRLK